MLLFTNSNCESCFFYLHAMQVELIFQSFGLFWSLEIKIYYFSCYLFSKPVISMLKKCMSKEKVQSAINSRISFLKYFVPDDKITKIGVMVHQTLTS